MEVQQIVATDANVEAVTVPETVEANQPPQPIQTPQNELYAALHEERLRRKQLEERLKEIEAKALPPTPPKPVEHSEEGLAIRTELTSEIKRLESTVEKLSTDLRLKEVLSKHPALRDNLVEFDEYRREYPGLPIDKVAMVFLAEKGALAPRVRRTGLEQPSGGTQQAPVAGMKVDDLRRLRTEDPRKYVKMLRSGQIKLADIQKSS